MQLFWSYMQFYDTFNFCHDDLNNECDDQTFKDWAYATSILHFIAAGIALFPCFSIVCNCGKTCSSSLANIISLAPIVCAIGLTVVDNDQCGKLHTLSMVYYILLYSCYAIVGLCCCCFCCMAGLSKN